jgi:orotate phosphoribosyltransferase
VLIVEDVITSGGQVASSANDLRRLGAKVHDAICVVERQSSGRSLLAANGIRLAALFSVTNSLQRVVSQVSSCATEVGLSKAELPKIREVTVCFYR